MHITFKKTFVTAVVAAFCFEAVARPTADGCQGGVCLDLGKRGPPIRPPPKRPAPDSPEPGPFRPGPGPGSGGAGAVFERPPSFTGEERDFHLIGTQLIRDMRTPPNPNDVTYTANRDLLEEHCFIDESHVLEKPTAFVDLLKPAVEKFPNIKLDKQWRHADYEPLLNDDVGTPSSVQKQAVSITFFDGDSKTLLVAVADNRPLKANRVPEDELPRHSEIWVDRYEHDGIYDTKLVICSQIDNLETQTLIREARAFMQQGANDRDVITLELNSQVEGERAYFTALAGSDNGRAVFRMRNDHHNNFHDRQIVRVHLWGEDRGQIAGMKPEEVRPIMIWELSD